MKYITIGLFSLIMFAGCSNSAPAITNTQKQQILDEYLIKRVHKVRERNYQPDKVRDKIVVVPENISVIYKYSDNKYFGFGSTGHINIIPCSDGTCDKKRSKKYENWNSYDNILRLLSCKDYRTKRKITYKGMEGEVLFCNKPTHFYEKTFKNLYTKEIKDILKEEQVNFRCAGWWVTSWQSSCLMELWK
ncbi:MAG: hypothetical protein JJW00_02335 [Sulfurimonas sp.]|nr:hypothetical protein [Sulfurimonas sp.]